MKRYPIVTLHSIDDTGSAISLSTRQFCTLLDSLAADGWVGCTLSEAIGAWRAGEPGQRFALTFDDAYQSVLTSALPALNARGFRATVFAVAGRLGKDNRWPGQADWVLRQPLLDAEGLTELVGAGWEVGSHGLTHRPLPGLGPAEIERELRDSRQRLEALGLGPVSTFAYPYGAHDAAARQAAGQIYDSCVGVRLAHASDADLRDPTRIPRLDAYYLRGPLGATLVRGGVVGRVWLAGRRRARVLRRGGVDHDAPAHLY